MTDIPADPIAAEARALAEQDTAEWFAGWNAAIEAAKQAFREHEALLGNAWDARITYSDARQIVRELTPLSVSAGPVSPATEKEPAP